MSKPGTFGSLWSVSVALAHVERVEIHDRARSFHRALLGDDQPLPEVLELTQEAERNARRGARDGLLMALRDGYIRATGRLSTTPGFMPRNESEAWRLHASDATLITTDEWRSGEFNFSRWELTGQAWQYIQIEVPDFMVKAIWPDWPECEAPRSHEEQFTSAYTTPYLQLMQEAIAHFGLTCQYQSKKENLSDWFLDKRIEGEPISRNLANAMATLVRLPTAQRGGAKRMQGPDLRSAKSAAETRGGCPEVDGK